MTERSWSRRIRIFAAVVVVAAAMPHFVAASVDSNARTVIHAGQHVTAFSARGALEPDPIGNGSIIIECVVLGDHPIAVGLPGIAGMRSASLPRQPLGPSKCWVQDKSLS